MAKTSKSTWKNFEREVAERDWDSKRNPLSGANNRCDDGSLRGGDVILPADSPFLIECKLRAAFVHHALFREAKEDAKKHGKTHAILYTKKKREHGWLVTIDGELFSEMIALYRWAQAEKAKDEAA